MQFQPKTLQAILFIKVIHIYLEDLHLQIIRLIQLVVNLNSKLLQLYLFRNSIKLKEEAVFLFLSLIDLTNSKTVELQQTNQIDQVVICSCWIQLLKSFLRSRGFFWLIWKLVTTNY